MAEDSYWWMESHFCGWGEQTWIACSPMNDIPLPEHTHIHVRNSTWISWSITKKERPEVQRRTGEILKIGWGAKWGEGTTDRSWYIAYMYEIFKINKSPFAQGAYILLSEINKEIRKVHNIEGCGCARKKNLRCPTFNYSSLKVRWGSDKIINQLAAACETNKASIYIEALI